MSFFEYSISCISSTFGLDFNAYGMYLTLFLSVSLFLFLFSHNIYQKIVLGIVFILTIINLVSSYSRGAQLGAVVSIVFFCIISSKNIVRFIKKHVFLFAVFLAIILIIFHPLFMYENKITQRFEDWESGFEGRQAVWKNALKLWSKHHIFGVGLGQYPRAIISFTEKKNADYAYGFDFVPGIKGRAFKMSVNSSYFSIKQFFRLEDVKEYSLSFYYILEGSNSLTVNIVDIHSSKTLFSKKLDNSDNWTLFNSTFRTEYPVSVKLWMPIQGSGSFTIDEINLENIKNPSFEQGLVYWEPHLVEGSLFHSHNSFLNILVERGIFALIVFVWMLVVVFKSQFYLAKIDDFFLKGVALAILAGIIGLLIHGMVDTTMFFHNRITTLLWFNIGLLFAIKSSLGRSPSQN
ncbi:O-antigen ligase family protein [Candidatus Woesearchaeota archaeon]|nr:O-antigen ligase family protein [Candidatus Woesearchaeota archaeon]